MSGRSTVIERQLPQTAVYWGNPRNDGYGGRTFDDPVEIACRWQEQQVLFVASDGKELLSSAVVFVAQALDVDGYLYLGTRDDLTSDELVGPLTMANAYPIRGHASSPSVSGDRFVRKVWLRKG